jgi:hypothetical protein
MQSQVIKSIQELFCSVERAQLQSLVIPVKLLNGIPEATFLKWFVKALNENLRQVNALKQIYLCIEDMQKSGVMNNYKGQWTCNYFLSIFNIIMII